jgi:hypothetical protein
MTYVAVDGGAGAPAAFLLLGRLRTTQQYVHVLAESPAATAAICAIAF